MSDWMIATFGTTGSAVIAGALMALFLWWVQRERKQQPTYTHERQRRELASHLDRLAAAHARARQRAAAERPPAPPGMAHEAVEPVGTVEGDAPVPVRSRR